jgi:uncharacterized protein (TIGR02246 family)
VHVSSELEAKESIRELLHTYCHRIDAGDYEGWSQLFADDAEFITPGGELCAGRDAILAWVRTAVPPPSAGVARKHLTVNTIVDVEGATAARALSNVLVVRAAAQGPMIMAGRYEDRLVRDGSSWRFQRREAHIDLVAGDLGPPSR